MNLTIDRFVPGFDEIVSSIYDLILFSFQTRSAPADGGSDSFLRYSFSNFS